MGEKHFLFRLGLSFIGIRESLKAIKVACKNIRRSIAWHLDKRVNQQITFSAGEVFRDAPKA